jgi:signal transduction histidine kinase
MQTMRRIRQRFAALPALAVDTGLAILLIVISLFENLQYMLDSFSPTAVGLVLATILPLALRRRYPMIVLITIGLATLGQFILAQFELLSHAWPVFVNPLGLMVALYTVAAYRSRRTSLVVLGLLVGLTFLQAVLSGVPINGDYWVGVPVQHGGIWLLGDWIKTRRAYTVELEQRSARLARERDQRARLAVAEERVRIARELHDVVAHHVSVMGIQATAARRVLDRCRKEALAALAAIETTSRQAMIDLHHLVGLLRREDETPDEGDELAPPPGLGQLPALIATMQKAGLAVDLQIEGDPAPLPAAVQLSVYRIVQEALTNTLKHAGPAQVRVTIRHHDGGVELEVFDDGQGPPTSARVGGSGLVGMRERVALHGGHLEVGAQPEGGFRVHAILNGRES